MRQLLGTLENSLRRDLDFDLTSHSKYMERSRIPLPREEAKIWQELPSKLRIYAYT